MEVTQISCSRVWIRAKQLAKTASEEGPSMSWVWTDVGTWLTVSSEAPMLGLCRGPYLETQEHPECWLQPLKCMFNSVTVSLCCRCLESFMPWEPLMKPWDGAVVLVWTSGLGRRLECRNSSAARVTLWTSGGCGAPETGSAAALRSNAVIGPLHPLVLS